MKITVCQMPNDNEHFASQWTRLIEHVVKRESDLVLLPEMTFDCWFAAEKEFEIQVWQQAVHSHEHWKNRLGELNCPTVLGTRPVNISQRRLNEAFVWEEKSGYRGVHHKYYLPDEELFWEASWYHRGDGGFSLTTVDNALVGFQICTEMWFFHRSRAYGLSGADILAVPRATPAYSNDKWLAGGVACAVVAGAYCLSSNNYDPDGSLGGQGWIIDPDGHVLGLTSPDEPFVTREIDISATKEAKRTYPRYVSD